MSDYEKSFVASDTVKTLNKYVERLKAVREAAAGSDDADDSTTDNVTDDNTTEGGTEEV